MDACEVCEKLWRALQRQDAVLSFIANVEEAQGKLSPHLKEIRTLLLVDEVRFSVDG